MTETVSQFRQRVARLRSSYAWRDGQAHYNAARCGFGGSQDQDAWLHDEVDNNGSERDPFHNDANIPAFLAAAVAAGVLREVQP